MMSMASAQSDETESYETDHYLTPLYRLSQNMYGQMDHVGERFCHEVARVTRSGARLVLFDWESESQEGVDVALVRLRLPVCYERATYGELLVSEHPVSPQELALPYVVCAQVASACGWLLHMLELGAVAQYQRVRCEEVRKEMLSRREMEVLRHMALGKAREDIAETMRITPLTVDSHRRAIYDKLGAHSPMEAILTAQEAGLLRLIAAPNTDETMTTASEKRRKRR